MMKKLLSLMCALCILCSCSFALAEADTDAAADAATDEADYGEALNPYTVESMGITIDLPENVNVVSEDETDDYINLTLAIDGRTDVSITINFTYVEDYADYATITELPDELIQQMTEYYSSLYTGGNPGIMQMEDDEEMAMLAPFIAGGQGQDGNTYTVFVNQFNGIQLTVSGGISAAEFDVDSFNAIYNVYWQSLFGMIDSMQAEE